MISLKGLRWSGAGICNGRRRLCDSPNSKRNFSVNRAPPARSLLYPQTPHGCLSQSSKHTHGPRMLFSPSTSTRYSSTSASAIRALPQEASTSSGWSGNLQASETLPDELFPSSKLQSQPETLLNDSTTTSITEHIGYLKEIGLDYGWWGPTPWMQFWLEHVHIWTGLSWASSVVLSAFVTRAILFRFLMKSSDMSARMRSLNPIINPLREEALASMKRGDRQEHMALMAKLRRVQKEAGISYKVMFMPMIIQLPLGYGMWRTCSGLAHYPLPALTNESFLWLTDLTFRDPYYILPLATSAFMYWNMKTGAEIGGPVDSTTSGLQSKMMRVFPVITCLFLAWQPALVQINFLFSSILIGLASTLIRQPFFRRFANLAPLSRSKPDSLSASPSSSTKSRTLELVKSADGRSYTTSASSIGPSSTEDKNALDRLITRLRPILRSPLSFWRSFKYSPLKSWQRFKDGQGPVGRWMEKVTGQKNLTEAERRKKAVRERKRRDAAKYEKERRGEEEAKRREREREAARRRMK